MKLVKIYVDEIPKSCIQCLLCVEMYEENNYCCALLEPDSIDEYLVKSRHPDCPLELANYPLTQAEM